MVKNCDNCINSGRPSYEYPCTVCATAYGSAPSKWEGVVPATADMVEVVRCKDCKDHNRCEVEDLLVKFLCIENAYCAAGERKDNG